MYKIKNGSQGFTLLELLVVVLIIGILAAIALPQYKLAVLKSKYSTMKDIVRVVKDAEERYYMLHGDYTMNFNELDIEYPGIYDNGTDGSNIVINGGFCSLNWWPNSPSSKGIMCILNLTSKIGYSQSFSKYDRRCRAMNIQGGETNTLQDKVCQLETGKSSPDKQESSSNIYIY